ncbi:hypothetical protein [Cellvibrio polysaccharolyticus]|uniref:hypothetical protein n=1 Tax=Cellvibrio polysaccharolyticus TaxID=2082724 RepID=UPI001881A4C6|nr:hypothetical protein [Cellvibrio polysaccharolyticus]
MDSINNGKPTVRRAKKMKGVLKKSTHENLKIAYPKGIKKYLHCIKHYLTAGLSANV